MISAMQLIVCLVICLGAGWLGSVFTRPSLKPWYASLVKPAWTPPNWVFAPVWTLLYVLMGVAAWQVWREAGLASVAVGLFAVQLILNIIWSAIFFRLRSPGAALIENMCLWLAIAATTTAFARVVPLAALLMIPYLLWVSYAVALNGAIWRLNS